MRVIVTGATSFIGKAVTKELLAGGHHVFAVVRPDSPGRGRLERTGAEAGEKTGEEIRYFTDGKPESSKNYLNGKLEGISREYYYSNGQLKSEFTYKANKQHGPFKYLNEDGTVREAGRYENDMRKE